MNSKDALGALEDVSIIKNLASAASHREEARVAKEQANVMDRASAKIDELRAIITNLRAELADANNRVNAAETGLNALRELNADHVAVANATAITLMEAVRELKEKSEEPDRTEEYYLRTLRTKNYHAQVNSFIEQGAIRRDPRTTDAIKRRHWYMDGLDPAHGF